MEEADDYDYGEIVKTYAEATALLKSSNKSARWKEVEEWAESWGYDLLFRPLLPKERVTLFHRDTEEEKHFREMQKCIQFLYANQEENEQRKKKQQKK